MNGDTVRDGLAIKVVWIIGGYFMVNHTNGMAGYMDPDWEPSSLCMMTEDPSRN